jgi:methyl-accepting chemotaxis protein
MGWKDVRISKKLFFAFGLVLILVAITAGIGWTGFHSLIFHYERQDLITKTLTRALEREQSSLDQANDMANVLLGSSPNGANIDSASFDSGSKAMEEARMSLEQMKPGLADLLKKLDASTADVQASLAEVRDILKKNLGNAATLSEKAKAIFQQKTIPALSRMRKDFKDFETGFEKELDDIEATVHSSAGRNQNIILALLAASVISGMLLSLLIGRMIVRVLNKSVVFASQMAHGDFSGSLAVDQKDELGELASSLNTMSEKLSLTVGRMSNEVIGLSSASNELIVISQDLSEGVQEVADRAVNVSASTEEMSTNMNSVAAASEQASTNVHVVATSSEEVSSSIDQVAEKTRTARNISHNAVALADSSSEKVNALGNAAEEINKVTQTITEISEQTNLLALNATIEAARAGEAGKGFAVVANEIKELARQTAGATGEIRQKIESIQSSTDQTVTEIRQITDVIREVDEIVAEIALAVEEQSKITADISENVMQAAQGIGEVNENVAQCSGVAGEVAKDISDVSITARDLAENSRNVERSAGDLAHIAGALKDMMMQFKVSEKALTSAVSSTRVADVPDLIRWGKSLMVDIPTIDEQHKQLVRLMNDLHKSMKSRESALAMERILGRLVDYTVMHFGTEEELFKKYNYPEREQHTAIHKKLVARVGDFQKKLKSGDATVSMDLMDFLKDWLVNHIKGTDAKYAPFLLEKGVR